MIATSRPLDFAVFGVPRSGTKGLVRALNFHPHVYCATERFHFSVDHAQLRFPDSFLDPSNIHARTDLKKIQEIRQELSAKQEVHHAGNKLPRYYFALERINREVPGLKNIWIYRSPYGFIPSWNRREIESHRGGWRAGQIGLFGVLELFVCIEACLALRKDIFVFPYAHGLSHASGIVLDALEFLGARTGLYAKDAFEKEQLQVDNRQQKRATPRSALAHHEQEFLASLRVKELDAILESNRGALVSDVSDALRDYLASIASVLPAAIDKAFKACDNAAVVSYGRAQFKRNRTEFDSLRRFADGSETLASFQRFGPLQRLKSLYTQRAALKRRLMGLRP